MCVCVRGSRKTCGKHLALSLAHMGTHGHVRIHKHTMANVKMYSLCMTNPNASAECTTLPPFFLPKWKQGWISAEGPGAIHLRLMPLHLMHKDHRHQPAPLISVLCSLKTIHISRTATTHTRHIQKLIDL